MTKYKGQYCWELIYNSGHIGRIEKLSSGYIPTVSLWLPMEQKAFGLVTDVLMRQFLADNDDHKRLAHGKLRWYKAAFPAYYCRNIEKFNSIYGFVITLTVWYGNYQMLHFQVYREDAVRRLFHNFDKWNTCKTGSVLASIRRGY